MAENPPQRNFFRINFFFQCTKRWLLWNMDWMSISLVFTHISRNFSTINENLPLWPKRKVVWKFNGICPNHLFWTTFALSIWNCGRAGCWHRDPIFYFLNGRSDHHHQDINRVFSFNRCVTHSIATIYNYIVNNFA